MTANDTMFDTAFMPPQELSMDVLMEKYAADHETGIDDVRRRVARALADHELPALKADRTEQFVWAQQNGFVPAGRINSAAGLGTRATLMNCFVSRWATRSRARTALSQASIPQSPKRPRRCAGAAG